MKTKCKHEWYYATSKEVGSMGTTTGIITIGQSSCKNLYFYCKKCCELISKII